MSARLPGRIFGRVTSSNVQKLLWLLAETGTAYERTDAGLDHGVVDTPEYRAMNPNGLVPTLKQDGFVLWESNSILRYLAATLPAAAPFYPAAPRARALVDQWLDWQLSILTPTHSAVFGQVVRTAADRQDKAAIARALVPFTAACRILDAALAGRAYLAAESLTLADIGIGPYAHRWFAMPIPRPETPHLRAWYERMLARPGYAAHVAVDLK